MRKTLTEKDINELRYQCRMGYIIPSMLFVIGTVLTSLVYEFNFDNEPGLNGQIVLTLALVFAIFSFFIAYRMNWKYILDIRNNEKVVETKTIQKKGAKKD